MRVLFADAVDEQRLSPLTDGGHEVIVDASLRAEDLPDHLMGVDVLVVRSTKVTSDAIGAADRLGLIVRAGAGTDNIDKAAASANGVYVCNVPGQNAIAVAELTMGLLLAVDRQIADNVADLRDGLWDKKRYTKADGLHGKKLALIGLGDIGLAVAERARAFGISVMAQRKTRSPQAQQRLRSAGVHLVDTLDDLLADADIVSLHVPKAAETTGMVDADFLSKMREGAILLNTSRGDVVDEEALLAALDERDLRAGLDVYANEPSSSEGDFDSRVARHPRVVGTHHIGASTTQAQEAVAAGTMDVIVRYIAGDVVNCVKLEESALGTCVLSIRHLDKVGVLAKVFAELRTSGCNIKQMQNQIFSGAGAAVATINVDGDVDEPLLERVNAIDEVLAASVAGC